MFCKCGNLRSKSHPYCNICMAEYMRDYRKTHKITSDERWKQAARQSTRAAVKRGQIKKLNNCEICGQNGTQTHHPDYTKPLWVVWLCKECHDNLHALEEMEKQLRFKGQII